MSQPLSVEDMIDNKYALSVTSRATEDTMPTVLEELTYKTIKAWLWIVESHLEKGIYILPLSANKTPLQSIEARYASEINEQRSAVNQDTDSPKQLPFDFQETFGDARVTVWDTFRSAQRIGFHLNSDDVPQVAVDTWLANHRAVDRVRKERTTSNTTQDTPPAPPERPATPKNQPQAPQQPSAPVAPPQAVEGAIVATRAPNANRPDYANGQLVSFTVTKIVATANKGSAVYQMWTPLGTQYPTLSVYKLKPDGTLKPDYEAIVPVLNSINLSLDKPEAMGTWRLVCKAAHVPNKETGADKEFLNVVSLTAI